MASACAVRGVRVGGHGGPDLRGQALPRRARGRRPRRRTGPCSALIGPPASSAPAAGAHMTPTAQPFRSGSWWTARRRRRRSGRSRRRRPRGTPGTAGPAAAPPGPGGTDQTGIQKRCSRPSNSGSAGYRYMTCDASPGSLRWARSIGSRGSVRRPAGNCRVSSRPSLPQIPTGRRMNPTATAYDAAHRSLSAVLDGVPHDSWTNPSPCEGWTARDVVGAPHRDAARLPHRARRRPRRRRRTSTSIRRRAGASTRSGWPPPSPTTRCVATAVRRPLRADHHRRHPRASSTCGTWSSTAGTSPGGR